MKEKTRSAQLVKDAVAPKRLLLEVVAVEGNPALGDLGRNRLGENRAAYLYDRNTGDQRFPKEQERTKGVLPGRMGWRM